MGAMDGIRGAVLPLPTIFDGAGEVDEPVMRELTQFYLSTHVQGFFLCGSYGQGPAMTIEQRKRVAALVAEETRGVVPIIVQVGAVDPYTAIELGLHARSVKADAIALVGPYYYNDRLPEEIIMHFEFVDREVQMPLLLYNNPGYQGYDITPHFMERLARAVPRAFGATIATSEGNGTIDEAHSYLKAVPDWAMFTSVCFLMPGMLQKIRGSMSPALSLAPELGVALVRAIDEGRTDKASWLQTLMTELAHTLADLMAKYGRGPNVEGLRQLGFRIRQYPRWPTAALPEEERAYFVDVLKRVRGATGWMLSR